MVTDWRFEAKKVKQKNTDGCIHKEFATTKKYEKKNMKYGIKYKKIRIAIPNWFSKTVFIWIALFPRVTEKLQKNW